MSFVLLLYVASFGAAVAVAEYMAVRLYLAV